MYPLEKKCKSESQAFVSMTTGGTHFGKSEFIYIQINISVYDSGTFLHEIFQNHIECCSHAKNLRIKMRANFKVYQAPRFRVGFASRNDELEDDSAHLRTDFLNWKGQINSIPRSPRRVQMREQAPVRRKFTQRLNPEVRAPDSQASAVSSSSNQMLEEEEKQGQEGLGSPSILSRESLHPNYKSHHLHPLWQICVLPKPPRWHL